MTIRVTPLTPQIGAEVTGVNLADLSEHDFASVHRAFLDHLVLFFRDQDLTTEQHMSFARRFGPLHVHPAAKDYRDHSQVPPEVLIIHADENTKRTAGDKWHSDVSCDAEPPLASILKL